MRKQTVIIHLFSFVETPRKFIFAELSIRKLGSSSVLIMRLFEFTRPFLKAAFHFRVFHTHVYARKTLNPREH